MSDPPSATTSEAPGGSDSEARSRALLRLMPDLMFRMDGQGRFLEFYAAKEHLLFAPPDQIVGRTVQELLPEPVASLSMDCVTRTLETGTVQLIEYSLPVAPGHRYFEARHVAMGPNEILAIVRDITTRKTAEEALRASERQYRMLMERASDAILITDTAGRFLAVNHQACLMLGRSESELLSLSVADLIQQEERTTIATYLAALREGEPIRIERTIRHLDGHAMDVEVSANLMPDGRIQGIVRDVTMRKRAEEALRKSEESFRLLIERSPDLVAVHRQGCVVWVNESCARSFRTTREQLVGRKVLDLIHPDDREAVADRIRQQPQLAEPMPAREERFVRDDGSTWYAEVVAIPLEFQGVPSSIVIAHDVTERKQAEEERRALETRIQHAQKLQSLGVLAGGIAHDFNNLLMGVLGNASLALVDLPLESPVRENLERIETTARRAADLTRQLLAYSGKGRFLVQPLDLSKVVEEMVHLLKTVISKRAVLRLDFHPNLPLVEADATQVRQVIMNLITNASDALGDRDGVIMVRTTVMNVGSDYLASTYLDDELEAGEYVVLEVSDTGVGMDRPTMDRLFDPFFTTKFTGRGLGLAAVLGIVRGHRGAIKVYSEPGHGTCFKVLLRPTHAAAPVPSPSPELESWKGQGAILVVDDEETVRTVARLVLERQGFTVLTAEDGLQAIDVVRDHTHEIRLVILDMTMPRMSGEETFRILRSMEPNLRILLSSGYNEQEAVNRFAGRGLSGFIQKPYTPAELLEHVARILGPPTTTAPA